MSTAFSFGLSGIAPVFIPLYLGDKFSPVIGLIMFISLRGLSILNFSAILVVIFQIIFGIIIYVLLSYFYLSKVLKIDIISLMRQ